MLRCYELIVKCFKKHYLWANNTLFKSANSLWLVPLKFCNFSNAFRQLCFLPKLMLTCFSLIKIQPGYFHHLTMPAQQMFRFNISICCY